MDPICRQDIERRGGHRASETTGAIRSLPQVAGRFTSLGFFGGLALVNAPGVEVGFLLRLDRVCDIGPEGLDYLCIPQTERKPDLMVSAELRCSCGPRKEQTRHLTELQSCVQDRLILVWVQVLPASEVTPPVVCVVPVVAQKERLWSSLTVPY